MSFEMIGIFINKINMWLGVYGILKKNDIIFVIDGVLIVNDVIGYYIKFFFFLYILFNVCLFIKWVYVWCSFFLGKWVNKF